MPVSFWALTGLAPIAAFGAVLAVCLAPSALAQRAFTWQEIRDKFEATNPTLRAGQIGIAESRAQEITANLRPNPDVTGTLDQFDPFPDPFSNYPYRPLGYVLAPRLRQLSA